MIKIIWIWKVRVKLWKYSDLIVMNINLSFVRSRIGECPLPHQLDISFWRSVPKTTRIGSGRNIQIFSAFTAVAVFASDFFWMKIIFHSGLHYVCSDLAFYIIELRRIWFVSPKMVWNYTAHTEMHTYLYQINLDNNLIILIHIVTWLFNSASTSVMAWSIFVFYCYFVVLLVEISLLMNIGQRQDLKEQHCVVVFSAAFWTITSLTANSLSYKVIAMSLNNCSSFLNLLF